MSLTPKQQLEQVNNPNLLSILSTIQGLPSQESLKHGAYVWKKLTAQGGDFVDFVVSDNESAYPDGGEQDGYWYEKVVEGIDPTLFGCTKYAVDKFTFSARTTTRTTISHSLGEVPKFFIIIPNSIPNGSWDLIQAVAHSKGEEGSNNNNVSIMHYYGGKGFSYSDAAVYNSSIMINSTSHYYAAGVEYTLITMA